MQSNKNCSKYVWLIGVGEISFIRSCDVEVIKATDCIIKVHITRGNIKWRSFALRFCASNHKSAWQPLLPLRRAYPLLLSSTLCKSHGDLHLSFFILSFGKLSMLERTWYIYIYLIGCGGAWIIIVDITLGVKGCGAKLQAPIFLYVRLKLRNHKYCVSVSNYGGLNDSWVCGLAF